MVTEPVSRKGPGNKIPLTGRLTVISPAGGGAALSCSGQSA